MKKFVLFCFSLALVLSVAGIAHAQGGAATKGPDPNVVRDAEAEKEARHELEVARHYFKLKKAYLAAFKRADELIAGYPNFSRLDEALYIAGMSSLYLSEGKGKQKLTADADKLREDAHTYLSRVVSEFPESEFRKRAEEGAARLGAAKPKQEK